MFYIKFFSFLLVAIGSGTTTDKLEDNQTIVEAFALSLDEKSDKNANISTPDNNMTEKGKQEETDALKLDNHRYVL